MRVSGVDVLYELMVVFCLSDDKGVIHLCGGLGAELMALISNSFINRLATVGLMGEPMAASCTYPGRENGCCRGRIPAL